MSGRLIGVGVGPGDPGLLTLNAIAALGEADVVAHFAKAGNASNARTIAASHLKAGVEELPLLYPVTTEIPKEDAAYRDAISAFYDSSAASIASRLDAGRVVAVKLFRTPRAEFTFNDQFNDGTFKMVSPPGVDLTAATSRILTSLLTQPTLTKVPTFPVGGGPKAALARVISGIPVSTRAS